MHKDIKYVLSNKSWNVMASSCIDKLGRWLVVVLSVLVMMLMDWIQPHWKEWISLDHVLVWLRHGLSLCFFSCQAARQHVVWQHVGFGICPPARHILFPGFYLFGDVTWCTRAFTAAPVALVALSYGIEERDIWSELMAQIHVCKTFFFWLAARKGRGSRECCGVDRSIGLGDEYGGLLWSWGGWG